MYSLSCPAAFFVLFTCSIIQIATVHGDKCQLKAERGQCSTPKKQWFWNKNAIQCDKFTFGGCGGNANAFVSQEECEKACKGSKSKLATPNKPPKQEATTLKADAGLWGNETSDSEETTTKKVIAPWRTQNKQTQNQQQNETEAAAKPAQQPWLQKTQNGNDTQTPEQKAEKKQAAANFLKNLLGGLIKQKQPVDSNKTANGTETQDAKPNDGEEQAETTVKPKKSPWRQ